MVFFEEIQIFKINSKWSESQAGRPADKNNSAVDESAGARDVSVGCQDVCQERQETLDAVVTTKADIDNLLRVLYSGVHV